MPETVHTDGPLTNFVLSFPRQQGVARLVAPELPVKKQSDTYDIVDAERTKQRIHSAVRAKGTPARLVDWLTSSDTFYCKDHALDHIIPDEDVDNADESLVEEVDAQECAVGLRDMLDLEYENDVATALQNTAVFTLTAAAGAYFDNAASTPITYMRTASQAIKDASGVWPNVAIIPEEIIRALQDHADIRARVNYTNAEQVNAQFLANLFRVQEILVPDIVENTAAEGQTAALADIWGTTITLARIDRRPMKRTYTAIRTFVWDRPKRAIKGWRVTQEYLSRNEGTRVRVGWHRDIKAVGANLVYNLTGCLS